MSNQTLWRTRMMFVSFNIAVKWVSYGNDGHFSIVCRGAFRNYEWNGIFDSFAPSYHTKIQSRSILIRI